MMRMWRTCPDESSAILLVISQPPRHGLRVGIVHHLGGIAKSCRTWVQEGGFSVFVNDKIPGWDWFTVLNLELDGA